MWASQTQHGMTDSTLAESYIDSDVSLSKMYFQIWQMQT